MPLAQRLRELQGHFRKKQHEMVERSAAVEVATISTTGP
jgi:hypothetical protein